MNRVRAWEVLDEKCAVDDSGCWTFTGRIGSGGYGMVTVDGRPALAHRVSYQRHVGPIPEGLVIDHLCRNRACVNPEHLEPVTSRENTLRGDTLPAANLAKTHCPAGHSLMDPDNLVVAALPERSCRACGNYRGRRRSQLVSAARVVVRMKHTEYISTFGQSANTATLVLATRFEVAS